MDREGLHIRVEWDTGTLWLSLDDLPKWSLTKYRKLLKLMAEWPRENREAWELLGDWLADYVANTLAAAVEAQREGAKRIRKRIYAKVRAANKTRDRAAKMQALYHATEFSTKKGCKLWLLLSTK